MKGGEKLILNVRSLREEKKLSQEELAKMAGISRTTLSKIESGDDISVTSDTLLSLAKALNTTVDGIIFYAENV